MRSRSMQALTVDIAGEYPGVVIYGIGDAAHQLRASDHNEDDTSGSRPAQSDADSNPEHRAIDVMLGAAITRAQMHALIERVVADEIAREKAGKAPRLFYVIFDGWIWSRSNGWVKKAHTDDPHRDHAHFSGLASGDEIADRWPAVTAKEDNDMAINEVDFEVLIWRQHAETYDLPFIVGGRMKGERNEAHFARKRIEAKLDAIGTASPEVAAILAGVDGKLAEYAKRMESELRDAVADLGEGGAAQVRADALDNN